MLLPMELLTGKYLDYLTVLGFQLMLLAALQAQLVQLEPRVLQDLQEQPELQALLQP
jgi:hypothetical protein